MVADHVSQVKMTHSDKIDSILLGYHVANFEAPDTDGNMRFGDVTASGRTLRVHVKGIDGYVDIDISQAVTYAFNLLTA